MQGSGAPSVTGRIVDPHLDVGATALNQFNYCFGGKRITVGGNSNLVEHFTARQHALVVAHSKPEG